MPSVSRPGLLLEKCRCFSLHSLILILFNALGAFACRLTYESRNALICSDRLIPAALLPKLSSTVYNSAFAAFLMVFFIQLAFEMLNKSIKIPGKKHFSVSHLFNSFSYFGIACLVSITFSNVFCRITSFFWFFALVITIWKIVDIAPKSLIFNSRTPGNISFSKFSCILFALIVAIHIIPWINVAWPVIENSRDKYLTGDQPAYLYLTESIVKDRDLDVSNNNLNNTIYHKSGQDKHSGGIRTHNPDVQHGTGKHNILSDNFQNSEYSTHRCGLPLIISPVFAAGNFLGGWERRLITMFMIIIIGLGFREIFLSLCSLCIAVVPSFILCLIASASVPAIVISTSIFPEIMIFFIISRLIRIVINNGNKPARCIEAGALFAFSPWLQDKYGLWTLPFFAILLLINRKSIINLVCLASPTVVSGIIMIKRNLFLYGQILPKNSVGYFVSIQKAFLSGLPGTWLDWGYGLFMLAPFSILTIPGLYFFWKKSDLHSFRIKSTGLVSVLLTGWLFLGFWFGWDGGFAPPNRFMFTLLPVCIITSIIATCKLHEKTQNAAIILWIITLLTGIEAMIHPESWYSMTNPAPYIANILGTNVFSVRYPPHYPLDFSDNTGGFLLIFLFVILAIYFSINISRSRIFRITQKTVFLCLNLYIYYAGSNKH